MTWPTSGTPNCARCAEIVATGPASELGRLGAMVAAEREPPTPLQRQMAELAPVILVAAMAVSVAVPAVGWAWGQPLRDMVLAGLTMAFLRLVAQACPERELHIVLDNYGTRSHPEVKAWLASHPRSRLHFTPKGRAG